MEEVFVVDPDNQEMFEVFCDLHPVEAFDLNKEKFIEYVKKRVPGIFDEQIETLIYAERNSK